MKRGLMGAALVLLSAASGARAGEFGRLPADWYTLPEDANKNVYEAGYGKDDETKDGNTYSRSEQAVSDSVDQIFTDTAKSLESSGKFLGSRERPTNAPDNWVPWHLTDLFMELGINAAGTAGLVTGIGEVSSEIYWKQSPAALAAMGIPAEPLTGDGPVHAAAAPSGEKADLALTDRSSYAEIEHQVDVVSDTVMATGRVTDRAKMRSGLLQTATDLQALMIDINSYNDSHWDISKFGLDVEISGSGQVATGFTVGGAIRLRFEWTRTAYGTPRQAEPHDGYAARREDLRKLLAGMAKDMDTVGTDLYQESGFALTQLRVGIGLYLSAKFGVVKGKIGVTGFAFFTKTAALANLGYEDVRRPHVVLDDEIPLIDDEPQPTHMAYAAANGIKYDHVPGGDGADRVIYYMTRDKFQKGLQRAAKMGAFFADRAHKKTGEASSTPRWFIYQLKPQFSLSLEGALKIVTIGGKVSLEMTFKRASP